ncbi:MAG: hypothetical protein KGI73_01855 [Patescibacteria group bacterium]|nr:hypothetical protein [Patescibacteria group bacterium]
MPDNGALERLSKKLDAGKGDAEPRRTRLFPNAPTAPHEWKDTTPPPDTTLSMNATRRRNPFKMIFLLSALFFVVALGISAFLFFSGQNTISTKNVDVQVSGPTEIGAGNTLTLQIVITNHNAVPITLTDLVIDFPNGTRSASDIATALPRTRISLGTINPGESVNRTITAALFDSAGTKETITASAEYHVPSSNAIFVSSTNYATTISSAPASIQVSSQSQAVSEQPTAITVTVTSNSPQTLSQVLLIATYPSGFAFANASPAPASGQTVWNLGDIEPGGTRTVTINGTFTGEDGNQRVITFTTGVQQGSASTNIVAPLATGEADFTITKPFISTVITLNGTTADVHEIRRGAPVNGTINWTNNLPTAIQSLSFTLSLTGSVIDQKSITVSSGFYSSAASTITWNSTTLATLANVAPGQSGTLSFSFQTLPQSVGVYRSPTLGFSVSVSGNRQTQGNVPETVSSGATTQALVATDLGLTAALAPVSGPMPPRVNTETVYAVTWNLTNTANDIANAAVTAIVPSYVRFIGNAVPSSENVSYDANTHTITWTPGDISAAGSRTVSFQIGLTPSVSQEGSPPAVVTNQAASAYDRFVQDTVNTTAGDLSTASASGTSAGGIVAP